ncbi:MAG: glycosyltransferase family 4 protein [Candidatus Pacebacteria bacterium]|nr:glycosyltransferase family 4 protein [Candidatus Paceibacterota bacterium]
MKSLCIATGIFAPDIGGPASYAASLAARLSDDGVRVEIITYSSVRRFSGDNQSGYRIHRIWSGWPWGIRHGIYFLRSLIVVSRCDAVLALNAVSAGVPAARAARLFGKPYIVRIAGDYAWEIAVQTAATYLMINEFQKSPKQGRIRRLHEAQKSMVSRANAVIVPSEYLAGIVRSWGAPDERVHVIYNGVDLPGYEGSKEDARRTIGVSGTIIVSAGRLVPWKGFRMLIKIMPQLSQVNQFFRLVIVGDGPDLAMLQSVIRNLGLERKVTLAGRKSSRELAVYLAAADMFVLNTGYEGFSHQVLEAMQAGVPVITTTSGGNPEVITQGENGLMVRYNDEFNLVEAIKALSKQAELREQFIIQGKKSVEVFSIEKMYQQTKQLLERLSP